MDNNNINEISSIKKEFNYLQGLSNESQLLSASWITMGKIIVETQKGDAESWHRLLQTPVMPSWAFLRMLCRNRMLSWPIVRAKACKVLPTSWAKNQVVDTQPWANHHRQSRQQKIHLSADGDAGRRMMEVSSRITTARTTSPVFLTPGSSLRSEPSPGRSTWQSELLLKACSPGRSTWPSGLSLKACSPSALPNTRRNVARFRLSPTSRLKNSSDYHTFYPVVQTPNWMPVPCLHILYNHRAMAYQYTMEEYKLIAIYTSTTYRGLSCISRYRV